MIQEFVAPHEWTCLALLRPGIGRIEAPGKVMVVGNRGDSRLAASKERMS